MSTLKINKFKSGDEITSESFNEMQNSLKSLKINEENLSEEALNSLHIKENSVFGKTASIRHSNMTVSDPATEPRVSFNRVFSRPHQFWPQKNSIVFGTSFSTTEEAFPYDFGFSNIENPSHYEEKSTDKFGIFLRASCRIRIPDVGARTFYNGNNPCVRIFLAYRYNFEFDPDPAMVDLGVGWTAIPSTVQEFKLAFSDKVPSDSSGSATTFEQQIDRGRFSIIGLESYEDYKIYLGKVHKGTVSSMVTDSFYGAPPPPPPGSSDSSIPWNNPFPYRDNTTLYGPVDVNTRYDRKETLSMINDVSYTTAFFHEFNRSEPSETHSGRHGFKSVQYAIWCHAWGFDSGHDGTDVGISACKPPKFIDFNLTDFNLNGYQIKR